jgi:hypothetical protein
VFDLLKKPWEHSVPEALALLRQMQVPESLAQPADYRHFADFELVAAVEYLPEIDLGLQALAGVALVCSVG